MKKMTEQAEKVTERLDICILFITGIVGAQTTTATTRATTGATTATTRVTTGATTTFVTTATTSSGM